jgi:hypothetical protein
MGNNRHNRVKTVINQRLNGLAGATVFILILPLVIVSVLGRAAVSVLLHMIAWLYWCPRGVNVIYVYSNSPHWKDHIEKDVLPRLSPRLIVMNRSNKRQ